MNRLLLLLLSLLPLVSWAQNEPEDLLQWVRLPQFQLQYHVPADWTPLRQTTDTSLVISYYNPDRTLLFQARKLRDAAPTMTPAQALRYLATQFGVPVHKPTEVAYSGIRFLETSGVGTLAGKPQRYQALAATHRNHVLLVYIAGPPDVFLAHQAEVQRILHSMTPYKKRQRRKGLKT